MGRPSYSEVDLLGTSSGSTNADCRFLVEFMPGWYYFPTLQSRKSQFIANGSPTPPHRLSGACRKISVFCGGIYSFIFCLWNRSTAKLVVTHWTMARDW